MILRSTIDEKLMTNVSVLRKESNKIESFNEEIIKMIKRDGERKEPRALLKLLDRGLIYKSRKIVTTTKNNKC